MKRFASHYLYVPDTGFLKQYVIEVEEEYVVNFFPLTEEIETLINRKLYIPNYPQERETSESLNVAIATAIVCAEFRRQAASFGN